MGAYNIFYKHLVQYGVQSETDITKFLDIDFYIDKTFKFIME